MLVHVAYKGEYPNFCDGVLQVIWNKTQYLCKKNPVYYIDGIWKIDYKFMQKFPAEVQSEIEKK